MKDIIRERAIKMSNAALALALVATSCFVGCNKKEDNNGTVTANGKEFQVVNEDNYKSFQSIQLGDSDTSGYEDNTEVKADYNPCDLFKPYLDETKLEETRGMLSEHVIETYCGNRIYKNVDGYYVLIDNSEALSLLDKGDKTYRIEKTDSTRLGKYTLTNEFGERTLIFENSATLKEFADKLQQDYNNLTSGQVGAIVNNVTFSPLDAPVDIELFDGTQKFFNLEQIMSACVNHIEELGCKEDTIRYEVKDDCITVTRVKWYTGADGSAVSDDYVITVPFGEKGETYYDAEHDLILPYAIKEKDTVLVSLETFTTLFGIDISQGSYTIPSTDVTLEDIIEISTFKDSGYNIATDKDIIEASSDDIPKKYLEAGISNDYFYNDDPVYIDAGRASDVYNAMDNVAKEGIDPEISATLGFDVPYLTGTAQEKADQLAQIMTDHYSNAGITFSSGGMGVAPSNWPGLEYMSEDEALAKCYEVLGEGKDLMTITVEEAFSVAPWLACANPAARFRIFDMTTYSFWEGSGNQEIQIIW
jgi:hypothetical protein